ncbi:hypothetical protein [Hyalangium gracile]|uniref:hypothetical protein n=1 Tax=Hyalangium gracile TaxID=394092 RepID=UPI001CC9BA41|nr:hypothetical protein [Hyalangium gracile]
MADYNQPDYVTQRPRYFNNQYLSEQDFIDEQKYHIDRQRRHDRLLHVSGIAWGLEVTSSGAVVTVAPGTAIDDQGRHLLLDTAQARTLTSEHQGTRWLLLRYQEVATNEVVGDQGVRGYTRFTETALVFHEAPGGTADDGRILLAELTVAADGRVTNVKLDKRRFSGVRLGGPSGKAFSLRSSSDGARAMLDGALALSEPLTIGTTNAARAQLEIKGVADRPPLRVSDATGKDLLLLGNDGILTVGAADRVGRVAVGGRAATLELGVGTDKQVDAGKITYQQWTDSLEIVGAGKTSDDRKLSVFAEGGTTFKGPVRLSNKLLYLRDSDTNQGLGWYGGNKLLQDRGVDGPFLFGWTGGALGTTSGGERAALFWNEQGRIGIGIARAPVAQVEIQATASNVGPLKVMNFAGNEMLTMSVDSIIKIAGAELQLRPTNHTSFFSLVALNDKPLYLRGPADKNHGLAWYGSAGTFANQKPDGPVLFGNLGGALGTLNGGERIALSWQSDGAVKIDSRNQGDAFVSGFPERVRMIRGSVHGDGAINVGTGFTVSKAGTGLYDVNFTHAFGGVPTIIATQQYTGSNNQGGDTRDNVVVVFNTKEKFRVKTGDGDGKPDNRYFHFIAIGT